MLQLYRCSCTYRAGTTTQKNYLPGGDAEKKESAEDCIPCWHFAAQVYTSRALLTISFRLIVSQRSLDQIKVHLLLTISTCEINQHPQRGAIHTAVVYLVFGSAFGEKDETTTYPTLLLLLRFCIVPH